MSRLFNALDSESTVNVKLWNKLATSFLEEYEGIVEQPMIVLISSCKVNFHRGTHLSYVE